MDSNPEQLDFLPREQRNQLYTLVFAFVCTIAIIFVSAYAPIFHHMEMYTPLIAIILVACLCLYAVRRRQMSMDLVMSAEYQLLLFSQAATLGAAFCLFVRRDATIVFSDDGLTKVFPPFHYGEAQALEGFFEQGKVGTNDRERILGAIRSGTADHFIFPIVSIDGEKKDYIVTVDPLARPAGFCVVRGREFHGKRSGTQVMPDVLRSTSIDKLAQLLATTTAAHYTTDNYGKFEYVNPAFARLFGYEESEVLDTKLSLHHLFTSLGAQTITEEYTLGDYQGGMAFITKSGMRMVASLTQHVVRDSAGKIIGATGTILSAMRA